MSSLVLLRARLFCYELACFSTSSCISLCLHSYNSLTLFSHTLFRWFCGKKVVLVHIVYLVQYKVFSGKILYLHLFHQVWGFEKLWFGWRSFAAEICCVFFCFLLLLGLLGSRLGLGLGLGLGLVRVRVGSRFAVSTLGICRSASLMAMRLLQFSVHFAARSERDLMWT